MKIVGMGMVLCVACCSVLAGEVPLVTPADFSVVEETHWLWQALASDAALNACIWLTTTGVGLVLGWLKWENSKKEKVVLFLSAGVRQTYEEFVRHAKQASEDGKLTDDERREAVRQAIEYAVQYARTEGFDLLKAYAKEALPALVDAIVRKIKGEAAVAKLPFSAPLPDLAPSARSAL